MWDTAHASSFHLSHAMPCPRCGHEVHVFLTCGDECDCQPAALPGTVDTLLLAG